MAKFTIITETGETREVPLSERWTKKCPECPARSFIPDDRELCDSCLLDKYGLRLLCRWDSCDPEGMGPRLYEEEDVLRALLLAQKGAPCTT